MASVLEVKNLSVSYDKEPILRSVSFGLNSEDSLAIIGPNGAGKSILIKALMDIVPYEGTITWARDVKIGYVPQKIEADRHLPINLRNLLNAKAAVRGIAHAEIASIGTTVGLTEKILETPIGHLSGGQFQRALIAFALLGKPSVLILDEPTASIDKPGEEQIYELIHRLQDTYGMTVILVSHDLSFVNQYSTKVLCLNAGHVLAFGTPEETLHAGNVEKLFGPHKYFHFFHDHEH